MNLSSTMFASAEPAKVLHYKTAVGQDGAAHALRIHVYVPPDWKPADRRPALLLWHGGGFRKGTPRGLFAQAEYFASRGMIAASAQYRLGVGIPLATEDGRSAVRWVKKHAGELGIDMERIVVGGGSAGGYIACAIATNFGSDDRNDDLSIPLTAAAIVGFNPALRSGVTERPGDGARMDLSGPINALKRGAPPAIMFYGTDDRLLAGGREFCESSTALRTRNELWTAGGMGHAFFNNPPWKQLTAQKADEFLVSLGLLKGKPTIEIPNGTSVRLERAKANAGG